MESRISSPAPRKKKIISPTPSFKPNGRPTKLEYYLGVAKSVSERSPCTRRKFGAIIVRNDRILSSGYNGSPRGTYNCGEEIPCLKDLHAEEPYTSYSHCSGVHAEDNAISSAGWDSCFGAVMYLAPSLGKGDLPCFRCRRKIINAQLEGVWYVAQDGTFKYASWFDLVALDMKWQEEELKC